MSIESLRKRAARGKEFALRKIYSIPCEELETALAEYDRLCEAGAEQEVVNTELRARVAELEEQANGLHELFKTIHRAMREVVEGALKQEMICDAYTAVRRLADRYSELAEREHTKPCVVGPFGTSMMLKDGTKVCLFRGEGAHNAHVWLEVREAERVEIAAEGEKENG